MPSSFSRLAGSARRRTVLVAAGALTVAAVGAGTTAAFAATSAPVASPSASTTHEYPGVGAIVRQLPQSLRTDLKTLRKDSASAKPGQQAAIKKKALAGGYGSDVEHIARLFAGSSAGKASPVIPAAMKADLKTLRGEAKGSSARQAQVDAIWKKALAGSYGSTIETAAKAADARFQQHQQHRSSSSAKS